jgi:prophage antirepressor-like protein
MSGRRSPVETFDYQCPDCGSIIRIPKQMTSRNRSRSVEGHIKDIWCHVCKTTTKHEQLSQYRPFIEEVKTNMKDWLVFNHSEFGQVRTIEIEGKLFLVGVDVARALEYANPSKAVLDHCKGISKLGIPSEGGEQTTNVIPESDLYRLIVKAADQSRNPDIRAKGERFEKWIFEEVLPQIRKIGSYSVQPMSELEILKKSVDMLIEQKQKLSQVEDKLETVNHRINSLDAVNVEGDPQQRLVKMVQKLAYKAGITYSTAWNQFKEAFNTAYRTNLTARINNYCQVNNLKKITIPAFLAEFNQLEDGIRVADKLLNM